MKEYGVELSNLLECSIRHGFTNKSIAFVEYLIDQAIIVHIRDINTEVPSENVKPYNPESGTAYYFTATGHQIRKQPMYRIDQEKRNYDNLPTVDDVCAKNFQMFHMVVLGTCFSGFVQFMDIAMGFISYQRVREEKIHFLLCSNICLMHQQMYFMTLIAS